MEIKITRKLLNSYRDIKKEILCLKIELRDMQTGDNGLNNSTVFDYKTGFPRPRSVVGFDWELYEKRQDTLRRKQEKAKAIEKWINAIEEGQTRYIFKAFYIDGMKWEKIAQKTGYSNSPDYPRLHIRDEYLKRCGIK